MRIITTGTAIGMTIIGTWAAGADSQQTSASPVHINTADTCAVKPAGSSCWKALANQPGCFFWNIGSGEETVTWTGECKQGIAQGHGTLTHIWESERVAGEGRLVDGKHQGRWHWHVSNGTKEEGVYTNGIRTGQWRFEWADGSTGEGAMVGDDMDGEWVIRLPDGKIEKRHYLKGVQQG